jgi:hypothetical protein
MPSWRISPRRQRFLATLPHAGGGNAVLLFLFLAIAPAFAEGPERIAPAPRPAPPALNHDIKAVPLPPPDSAWFGVLAAGDGALPEALWQGTPRAVVAAALPQLVPSRSPSLQRLARRLLLSDAIAPEARGSEPPPGLLVLRLQRIVALGLVDEGLRLLAALPKTATGEAVDRVKVELAFAANDRAAACKTVQDGIAQYRQSWWDQAQVACEALGGEGAKAALGLSLLREEKAPPDQSFASLVEALSGGKPRKLDRLPDATPVRLALLAATKQPLPSGALAAASPAALHAWATNGAVPAAQRLDAAERAEALGALAPEALSEIYLAVAAETHPAAASKKEKEKDRDRAGEDARRRAALYAAAHATAAPVAQTQAVAAFLAEGKSRGRFQQLARLAAPLLLHLTPAGDGDGFAADAARALLATGHAKSARPWIEASEERPLQLLYQIATGDKALAAGPGPLSEALAALADRDAAVAVYQSDLLIALLHGLGDPVIPPDKTPLTAAAQEAALPSAALWIAQGEAAAAKRRGETILLTLLLAAGGDRLTTAPLVLDRAVAGLRAAGVEEEARALAVEAALAAGI